MLFDISARLPIGHFAVQDGGNFPSLPSFRRNSGILKSDCTFAYIPDLLKTPENLPFFFLLGPFFFQFLPYACH